MACRDVDKANKAIEDIKLIHKKANIVAYQLDLASFQSIRDFVNKFQKGFVIVYNEGKNNFFYFLMQCPLCL